VNGPARATDEAGLKPGVIDLGIMGLSIARNCIKDGFPVAWFDVVLDRPGFVGGSNS